MTDVSVVASMVRSSEQHDDTLAGNRIRAMEYHDGKMTDTPSEKGRSAMMTRDVRVQIKRVLPSIMRTLLGGKELAEYLPGGEGDEEGAQQATDYVNRIIAQEVDLERVLEDAVHDALLLRNGIIRWDWKEVRQAKTSLHTGLDEMQLAELIGDADVEVLQHSKRLLSTESGVAVAHDVRIRRMVTEGRVEIRSVPRERFLIHPDALNLRDSLLTGDKQELTRSTLIEMGYDPEVVMGLGQAEEEDEDHIRRDRPIDGDEPHGPNETVDYYDIFVRVDMDGDGIAELRRMCFAGGLGANNLLFDEEVDEIQCADIKVMSRPHQWEGISLFDDVSDIQRAKTVLLRNTLDNIYWQNNPQPLVQRGAVPDMEAVYSPEFGKPIEVRDGTSVRDAIGFNQVPFVAQQSFAMMEYLDQEAQDRTGVSDASAGLAPDALQNMTATASAMINQAGIGQTELMVKTAARGVRDVFRGLLKLIIRHQDQERTVRLRGEWVRFDPRHWNSDMDCTVNVGLGAGTRERDMQVVQMVMGLQQQIIGAMGADNPFVKPENLWASISRMVEAAGLQTPEEYFTEPDPREVEAMKQRAAQAGQAEMAMKQADAQMKMQVEQAKIQANRDKEAAQMQADLQVEDKRLANDLVRQNNEIAWEREKHEKEQRFKLMEMGVGQGADGQPINAFGEMMTRTQQMAEILGKTHDLFANLSAQVEQSNRPKRVVRDEQGEIVGVEPIVQ